MLKVQLLFHQVSTSSAGRARRMPPTGDWSVVARELPRKVGHWMERLQQEGVRGADLVFACIGPALEIYSRYAKVMDAEDRLIPLGGDPEAHEPHRRGYLAYVWEVVGRLALEQVLGGGSVPSVAPASAPGMASPSAAALDEDARLTALFLWTMQATATSSGATEKAEKQNSLPDDAGDEEEDDDEAPKAKPKGGFSLPFDVVRRFAQPLGIHLPEWEGRVLATEKGLVRLLPVRERASQLLGEEGAAALVEEARQASQPAQMSFLAEAQAAPTPRSARKPRKETSAPAAPGRQATTLDRLHTAMLLQRSGQTMALRALLHEENERAPDFLRLANALSALYPRDSEEKRLLDAVLVNMGR